MPKENKYTLLAWWTIVPLSIFVFFLSINDSIKELSDLRKFNEYEEAKGLNWQNSDNPNADFLELLYEFKNLEDWSSGVRIYNILTRTAPDNGYLDALAIKILLKDSYTESEDDQEETFTITNETNIRLAIKHFDLLLSKKEYKKYSLDYLVEERKGGQKSYTGLLSDMKAIYKRFDPELSSLRDFAKIYRGVDNPSLEEIAKRAKTIQQFADILINNSESYIDLLVGVGIANATSNTIEAHKYGTPELISLREELKKYLRLKGSITDSQGTMHAHTKQFSRIAHMTIPSMPAPENFEERLKINRLLEYTFFDRLGIKTILLLISLSVILLAFVILRWHNSIKNDEKPKLSCSTKYIIQAFTFSFVIVILYTAFRNELGSKQYPIASRSFYNIAYYSEFVALILLSVSLPIIYILRKSTNESTSEIKQKSLYFVALNGALIFILSLVIPLYEAPYLLVIFFLPWIYIVFYFIRYFILLTKSSEMEFNILISKLSICFLTFFGLILTFIYIPVNKISELSLYSNETLLKPAYEIGYALPYAEAQNLVRVQGLLDELDSLPEYKRRSSVPIVYKKLKVEMYKPPVPTESDKEFEEELDTLGGRRALLRRQILKARQEFLDKQKEETQSEDKKTEKESPSE